VSRRRVALADLHRVLPAIVTPAITLVSRIQRVTLVTREGVWIHFVMGTTRS
jgi:hypothetical protein